MVLFATARINETDPGQLAGSRRVNASYPECSRSNNGGVHFAARCEPGTSKILAAKTVKIGGAGRNRTNLNNPDRGRKSFSLCGARTIQANSAPPGLTLSAPLLTVSLTVNAEQTFRRNFEGSSLKYLRIRPRAHYACLIAGASKINERAGPRLRPRSAKTQFAFWPVLS
jgi:hypothetical protein